MNDPPGAPNRDLDPALAFVIGFTITVSTMTRRGRKNLHTFGSGRRGRWKPAPPPTNKQTAAALREIDARREKRDRGEDAGPAGWTQGVPHDYPAGRVAGWNTFALGEGVDIQGADLHVILSALRRHGRHEVDLADIKVVLSQLGPRIKQLGDLPPDQARHAIPALYTEIVRRCTTLAVSD
ncbi:MAG: hypothetical protein ACXVYI_12090 [Mycobacterium sp.]